MKKRVRIDMLPKAGSGLDVKMQGLKAGLGLNSNVMPWPIMAGKMSKKPVGVNSTLYPVPRDQANLEAEKGEVATVPGKGGIPSTYKIAGQRHHSGGTPLNLPGDSFIYSDTRDMRIKDPEILKQFGMGGSGPYTPADIAKKYDINKFKKILADPDTDDLQKKTAEGMIANYNLKLAKLALLQESMKGFPQKIPAVAMPYLEEMNMDPSQFVKINPQGGDQENPGDDGQEAEYGGIIRELRSRRQNGPMIDYFQSGGSNQIIAQPKRSDRVIYNPATGQMEVYNWSGKKIGILNPPQQQVPIQQSQIAAPKAPVAPVVTPVATTTAPAVATTTTTVAPYTGTFKDPRLAQGTDLQEAYGRLEQTMLDPNNAKLRTDLVAQYRKNMDAAKPNTKTGLTQADIDAAKAMSDDQVVNNFLEAQKQVFAANSAGLTKEGFDPKDSWDQSRSNYENTITGMGFTPLDKSQTAAFQGFYAGLQTIADKPEYKDLLKDYQIVQKGVGDEKGAGTGNVKISDIDGWVGNTTIGQAALYKPTITTTETPAADATTPAVDNTTPVVSHLPDTVQTPVGSPWWLQDIIKTAHAAGNLARIKKYMPWQATPNVVTPDVTFYDPERQLAANSELVNQGANAAAQFTGPQSFNARFNELQGTGFKNAADTLANYNNLNVGISNTQAANNAATMNTAALQKASDATSLWDKYQTVNQNFDSAKSEARDALVNQYTNAITNKNYTANLNKMYPQFAVNPAIGGEYYFHDPRALTPDYTQQTTPDQYYEQMLQEHPTWKGTDEGLKMAWEAAKLRAGVAQTPVDAWTQYQQNQGIIPQYPGTVAQ